MATPDPRRGDEPDLGDADQPTIEVAQPGRAGKPDHQPDHQPDDQPHTPDADEARGLARP